MAKIDEERMLVRLSLLIRDTDNVSNLTFVTSNLVSTLESYVTSLYAGTGIEGLIVEVNDVTTGWTVVNNASTTTTTTSTTSTTSTTTTTTAGP